MSNTRPTWDTLKGPSRYTKKMKKDLDALALEEELGRKLSAAELYGREKVDRGWGRPDEVGWGVLRKFGGDEKDLGAQKSRLGNVKTQKMVKNDKGLWVKATEENAGSEDKGPRIIRAGKSAADILSEKLEAKRAKRVEVTKDNEYRDRDEDDHTQDRRARTYGDGEGHRRERDDYKSNVKSNHILDASTNSRGGDRYIESDRYIDSHSRRSSRNSCGGRDRYRDRSMESSRDRQIRTKSRSYENRRRSSSKTSDSHRGRQYSSKNS